MFRRCLICMGWMLALLPSIGSAGAADHGFTITETDDEIQIVGPVLQATIRKRGYVSGVKAGSLLDVQTGARDLGYGLDIVDWIMEPGSDEAYRNQLPGDLPYVFSNAWHGKTAKRSIEGPQICTKARELKPRVVEGKDFVAVEQKWNYTLAAPGKKAGSEWRQWLVFPKGKRYFISADRMTVVNESPAMFFRIDMPGHIKHQNGDSFSEIYLSYRGRIPASEFTGDFAPDEKFNYRRDRDGAPERFIRAYHTRDPKTGRDGPWLAGMTLNPSDPSEGWCHQRKYVCLIEEIGERAVKPGDRIHAAFVVGWFDTVEEMHAVYDQFKGHSDLEVDAAGWRLTK